ncbi:LysR family transcriptional regulator [Mesorhizobium sp. 128a]
MEFRQLKYFVGVVEAGSFTKAAAMLNVAQSALSLHVRQLEEEFGSQLLIRDRSGISVTPSGAKLLERARTILNEIRVTKIEMSSTAASGEVTIGIPSGAARVLSGPLLEAVRSELPLVTLKMVEGMTGPLEEWMAAGRFNLAILYRTADAIAGLPILAREDFCLVAPPNLPPFPDVVALSDLHAFPLAVPMRTNNVRRSVADVVAQHGCRLDVRFEVDSLSTIISMVTEGKAYSILTPSAIHKEVQQGLVHMVRIVDPVITRSVVLAVNPKDESSPSVSAVRKLIPGIVRELIDSGHWLAKAPTEPASVHS